MDPITLALLMMGGGALLKGGTQLGTGLVDKIKGKKLEEEAGERPAYEIPESVDAMISQYQDLARGQMPGYDLAKQSIGSGTAKTIGSAAQLADSPVGALAALGGAQEREMNAMRDLNMRASQYQTQARQNLANVTGQRAQYEDQEWRQNQLLPWEIDMNRAMQLQTSGAGNIMGAADTVGSTMGQMGSMLGTIGMQQQMMPQYGQMGAQQYVPSQGYGVGSGMGDVWNQQQMYNQFRQGF